MPPLIKVNEKLELVEAKSFPYAKFHFEKFNPVQSRLIEYYEKDNNIVVATSTSSGKTACAEILLSHEIRKRGGKGLFLVPLKALAQEKIDDWLDKSHHFADLKVSVCTGDYKLTAERKDELDNADLIILSYEMFNSRIRNINSEQSQFLLKAGTLVVDECFPASTKIRVKDNIEMSIKSIVNNSEINSLLAYDEITGKVVEKKILRKITRKLTKQLVSVKHQYGQFVCTEDHKIYTMNRGYVKAVELNKNDVIKCLPISESLRCPICDKSFVLSVKKWGRGGIEEVYDLEVEDCHNYFANGVLVSNCHSVGMKNRGPHLECALMNFTEVNKACRLVLLSATVPNVEEISEWASFVLNNKETVLIKSLYRPCPLYYHYEKYFDQTGSYDDNEQEKVSSALQIVEYYPDDKFLLFVHTKKTGEMLKRALAAAGIKSEFHNADLDKNKRTKIEKDFREGDLRAIIATSTLAAGINVPARRVVVLGVHRGLEEVEVFDIHQECGRAGRPQYDPAGDAYVLLPESTYDLYKSKLKTPQSIMSQMLDEQGGHHKNLAFHIVSEIHQGNVKTKEDVHYWYRRSLAYFQTKELDDSVVDGVMDLLKKYGAIWEEEGQYTVTSIGKIASLFYFSPFDVSDLKYNFTKLFDDRDEKNDIKLALALANTDTQRFGIVSKTEREEMAGFANEVSFIAGRNAYKDSVIKAAYAYYQLLNGEPNKIFASIMRNLQFDYPRLSTVLQSIDGFTGKWNKKEFFKELQLRITYGVKGNLVYLCQLPNIGKVRANKLWQSGIKSVNDVVNNPDIVRKVTGLKADKLEEIFTEAKKLLSNS